MSYVCTVYSIRKQILLTVYIQIHTRYSLGYTSRLPFVLYLLLQKSKSMKNRVKKAGLGMGAAAQNTPIRLRRFR